MSADDLLYSPMNGSTGITTPAINSDLRIPDSWLEVIGRLRNYSNDWANTALAGGALRDLDLGRQVKDVDIFLPFTPGLKTLKILEKCLDRNGIHVMIDEVAHNPSHNSALSNGTTPVLSHFQFDLDGWDFEITQKAETFTQRSILDSFDLGICMICLDGDQVYRSPEYQWDVAHKRISVVRSTGGREAAHARRLQRKYMSWRIVE